MTMTARTTIFLLLAVANIAAAPLPKGWRAPTALESNQKWRNYSPHRNLSILGDFNGDGAEDQAKILVKVKGDAIALFAFVSDGKKHKAYKLEEMEDALSLEVMGIDIAPAGEHKTACGKGYWACGPGEPPMLNLTNPGIDFFREESANSFFIWNNQKREFDRIWISD